MSSVGQDTEQLLERIHRLEALVARNEPASGDVTRAPRGDENRADIRNSDFSAQGNVNTSGRDLYVVQLEERVRFLEGLDRAHRTRRTFFMLSALCFVAALGVAAYAMVQIVHLANDLTASSSASVYPTAFRRYFSALAVAGMLEMASIALLIFGLFARPPRTR